jgi:hypothetical protein
MEAFPVAPELMQAFPLGALSLLVTVASTVAAQHGVDRARRICRELAANDELWIFIAGHVDRRIELVDDIAPDTKREMPQSLESPEIPEQDNPKETPALSPGKDSAVEEHAIPPAPESKRSAEVPEVSKEPPARVHRSKSKRRRRNTNGVTR